MFLIFTNSKCQTQRGHLQHHSPNTYLTHFFAPHPIFSSFSSRAAQGLERPKANLRMRLFIF